MLFVLLCQADFIECTFQGSLLLEHVSEFPSFLQLNNILLFIDIIFVYSLLMGDWVVLPFGYCE